MRHLCFSLELLQLLPVLCSCMLSCFSVLAPQLLQRFAMRLLQLGDRCSMLRSQLASLLVCLLL